VLDVTFYSYNFDTHNGMDSNNFNLSNYQYYVLTTSVKVKAVVLPIERFSAVVRL
jgi:hypothetical protein